MRPSAGWNQKVTNPATTILIVGFQAKNTLGRRIVEHPPQIKIFGVYRRLNAEVRIMNAFSAHAGRTELVEFATRFKNHPQVLLVHGEDSAIDALRIQLEARGLDRLHVQREGVPLEV